MTDLVSGFFSNCGSDDFVVSALQSQMYAKVSRLVDSSSLSKEEISQRSGIDEAKLNALLEGTERVSLADMAKIIDAVGYFNQED